MAAQEIAADKDAFADLLSSPDLVQAGLDTERAYLAVLLDAIGFRDEAARVLQDRADTGTPGGSAALRNIEGMLAARHGRYQEASGLLEEALALAPSAAVRVKILANLAAVSLQAGRLDQAETWAAQGDAAGAGPDPAAAALLAAVRAGISAARADQDGLREATAALGHASAAWADGLEGSHPQRLVILANMANAEVVQAQSEGDLSRLERAASVLEIAAFRLAAELGADHPRSLAAAARLASAGLSIAHGSRSPQKLAQAIEGAHEVHRRISDTLGATSPEALELAKILSAAGSPPASAGHLAGRHPRPVMRHRPSRRRPRNPRLSGRAPVTTARPPAPGQPRREPAEAGGRRSRALIMTAVAIGIAVTGASFIFPQTGALLAGRPHPIALPSARATPSTSPAHRAVIPIPMAAACRWAYPGLASGKTAGAGYSILCLGPAGQVLGGFSGSHSLAAWCAEPGHTAGQDAPQPALIDGSWQCTSDQPGQELGQGTLVLRGNGTGYDLDAVNTRFTAATDRIWTVQNIEYFPRGNAGNPAIAIAGSPYTDVAMGRKGPWTYQDCLDAPYGASTSATSPNLITGSSLQAGEGICVKTQNTAAKHDGDHIVLVIIRSISSTAVTVQVTVWS
jgi:hypothetical protein